MAGPIVIVGDPAVCTTVEVVTRATVTPGTADERPNVGVWHFSRADTSPPFDPTNVAAAFWTWWNANVMTEMCAQFTMDQVEARSLDDPTSPTGVHVVGSAGGNENDMYANDAAIYIQIKSGLRGRNFFGSKHFGGFDELSVTNGLLAGAAITTWGDIRDAILDLATTGITDADGNVWKLVILSKTLSQLEVSPVTIKFSRPIQCILNKRIGTMGRRRGPREKA